MQEALKKIQECDTASSLLGLEGEAASIYFSAFDDLILQQKDDFQFQGRNRRPPTDEVNAMLSFSYTLLTAMCASALETVGLDPYVGFYHTDRPGRKSLALDMVEELRSVMADRFVLTLINKKVVGKEGVLRKENGAVIMNDDLRKTFLAAWQRKKQEMITHPFLGEKMEWGMVPFSQAMLLCQIFARRSGCISAIFLEIGGKCMLVLITYDVNTENAAGKTQTQKSGKTVPELWTKSAKFRF